MALIMGAFISTVLEEGFKHGAVKGMLCDHVIDKAIDFGSKRRAAWVGGWLSFTDLSGKVNNIAGLDFIEVFYLRG